MTTQFVWKPSFFSPTRSFGTCRSERPKWHEHCGLLNIAMTIFRCNENGWFHLKARKEMDARRYMMLCHPLIKLVLSPRYRRVRVTRWPCYRCYVLLIVAREFESDVQLFTTLSVNEIICKWRFTTVGFLWHYK